MNYLYEIAINLYKKLISYYHENNIDSSLIDNQIIEQETTQIINSIINGEKNYFYQFSSFFLNYFFDFDFIAENIENGIYLKIPNNRNKKGNYQNVIDYKNKYRQKLEKLVYETIIVRKVINQVFSKMQLYYIDDFMKKSYSIDYKYGSLLRNLYNRLSIMNDKMGYRYYDSYEELLNNVNMYRLELYDKISIIIDSPLLIDDIISQQKYYISEIEKIKQEFNKRGNITNLSNEVFQIYSEFFNEFKEKAICRIDNLTKQKNLKIGKFKF